MGGVKKYKIVQSALQNKVTVLCLLYESGKTIQIGCSVLLCIRLSNFH